MAKASTARLGVFSEEGQQPALETANTSNVTRLPRRASTPKTEERKDHFISKEGVEYAGTHLIVELWNAKNLGELEVSEKGLVKAAKRAGANVLHVYMHHFGPGMGVSGVVVLAESHISIHTWPERGYAAIDIFMCGTCDPYKAVTVIKQVFQPEFVQLSEHKRGLIG
ncbi:MAG: adenosylmethionine decarboxylase [Alphaproteobacteria bacterium]